MSGRKSAVKSLDHPKGPLLGTDDRVQNDLVSGAVSEAEIDISQPPHIHLLENQG